MPRGRTHDLVNATVYTILAVGITVTHATSGETLITREEIIAFTIAFIAGTLWLSPDLDLPDTLPKKRWGPLKVLWEPYTRAFKHRGISHGYVLGPLTRLLYLLMLVSPLWWFDPTRAWAQDLVGDVSANAWVWLLVGYYAASWTHLIADRVKPKL